jgi:hypothetical protein
MKHITFSFNRVKQSSFKSNDLMTRNLDTFFMRSTFIRVREKRQVILRDAQTIELIKVKINNRIIKKNLMKKLQDDLEYLTLNTEQQTIKKEVKMKRLKQKRFDEQKFDKLHYHNHLSR